MGPCRALLSVPEPKLAELLQSAPGRPPFPGRSDRVAWESLAAGPMAGTIIAEAQRYLHEPIRPVLASEILAFARTGDREPSERSQWARRRRLVPLVLAECLEGQGRFLDAAQDAIWAICEESTWLYAAHLGQYRREELPDAEVYDVDLGVAGTAMDLAEAAYLLGEALHPTVRRRLRLEIARRALDPFLARDDFWWLRPRPPRRAVNNWTAVCVAGVVGAALYLEPEPARLAALIAKGLEAMGHYLASFAPDGGTPEGPGYWSYGFSCFAFLSHLLECRTEGAITLFDNPLARQAARFPLRVELSPGRYVPFSDASPDYPVSDETLAYLARRLGDGGFLALSKRQRTSGPAPQTPSASLRSLVWLHDEPPAPTWQPALRDWVAGPDWLVARHCPADGQGLVVATKGGHNGESHNHNDLGQFVVHWRGESPVADLGAGAYTREYFIDEHRYRHPAASSYGHAVPVVDGQGQLAGREHRAEVVHRLASDGEDAVTFELRSAYAATLGLVQLRRTVSLERVAPNGRVVVVDELVAREPRRLESALITLDAVEEGGPGLLRIRGRYGTLLVRYEPAVATVHVELLPAVALDRPRDVRRVSFAWPAPRCEGAIRLELSPE